MTSGSSLLKVKRDLETELLLLNSADDAKQSAHRIMQFIQRHGDDPLTYPDNWHTSRGQFDDKSTLCCICCCCWPCLILCCPCLTCIWCKSKYDNYKMDEDAEDIISKQLLIHKNIMAKSRTIAITGTNNSGKSTFFKQILRMYDTLSVDHYQFIHQIYEYCFWQIKIIIQSLDKKYDNISIKCINAIKVIEDTYDYLELDDFRVIASMEILWSEPYIQTIYENKNILTIKLENSCKHFMDKIGQIHRDSAYTPTDDDILLFNDSSKTGISEIEIEIENKRIDLKKMNVLNNKCMSYFFDSVSEIFFVASLSCYDIPVVNNKKTIICGYILVCMDIHRFALEVIDLINDYCPNGIFDELKTNNMGNQLKLFDKMINNKWMNGCEMILILSKCDLFKEQIKTTPITQCSCFKDFKGDICSYDESIDYIKKMFLELCKNKKKIENIHWFIVNSLDSKTVQNVFKRAN
eukprot:63633_1